MKSIPNKYILLLAGIASFSPISCKKYLDEKSNKIQVVPSSVTDLQGLLDNDFDMNKVTACFGQTSDDDYFMNQDNYNAVTDLDRLAYTWRVKTYNYPNEWALCYVPVYNSNYCLDELKKTDKTMQNEIQWNNVKGSAHFFRGYYYLNLVWEFAMAYDEQTAATDAGIVLRKSSDFNLPSVRASIKECYNQIIDDLKEAINYLPANPLHPMRPSKAAAYGTLARTYLSMRQYDSAYKYADLSLQIKADILDYNSSEVNAALPVPFKPFNKEIIFYTAESIFFLPIFSIYSSVDSAFFATYNNNDLRRKVFYFSQGGYASFKGHYTANSYIVFSGITAPEMLLTRAECLARKGKIAAAMNDLNTLLPYRWATGTFTRLSAASQEQAINLVLEERRKELTMRSLRWIDIKRLNKEGRSITLTRKIGTEIYTLPPNDKRYALPIPNDIIIQTGIQQN